MKRSEINAAVRRASQAFAEAGWALPPNPKWDVTDMGLGRFKEIGLVLINLAEEPEYCEKLMFSDRSQITPLHTHRRKKEDIICRRGELAIEVWPAIPDSASKGAPVVLPRNGEGFAAKAGEPFTLRAGERVTLVPGVYHAFWAASDGCVIGEVSTANDDANDNVFVDPDVGRFPSVEEDETPLVRLISES